MPKYSYTPDATPIAALTDLDGKVIVACRPYSTEKPPEDYWYLQSTKIVITRFWSASTAQVTLACDLSDSLKATPVFPEGLGLEREVRIWLGYLDTNMVDYDVVIDINLLEVHTRPVFLGVLETASLTTTDKGGHLINLSARDRMKWLMDTSVTFNPYRKDGQVLANLEKLEGIPRSDLILRVARMGIGQAAEEKDKCTTCGKDIELSKFTFDAAKSNGRFLEPSAWYEDPNPELSQPATPATPASPSSPAGSPTPSSPAELTQQGNLGSEKAKKLSALIAQIDGQIKGAEFDVLLPGLSPAQVAAFEAKLTALRSAKVQQQEELRKTLESDKTVNPLTAKPSTSLNTPNAPAQTGRLLPTDPLLPTQSPTQPSTPSTPPQNTPGTPITQPEPPAPAVPEKDSEGNVITGFLGGNPEILMKITPNPAFRIYTARPKIDLTKKGDFLVNDQVPAELIKFFAMQEIYPTELFQDSRDGNFYYAPRCNDTTGLTSPGRFYRTYFSNIPEVVIDGLDNVVRNREFFPNQLLHRFKKESTTIGLKTNIIVRGSSIYSEQSTSDFNIHLRVRPSILKGQDFACKFTIYQDETISTIEEASMVAFNVARLFGRETRAATAVMIGDSTLVPGEICQVVDSFARDGTTEELRAKMLAHRTEFTAFNDAINPLVSEMAERAKKAAEVAGKAQETFEQTLPDGSQMVVNTLKTKDGRIVADPESMVCEKTSFIGKKADKGGLDVIGFNAEPDSIWRVEAVIHNYNSGGVGYTTEVAWSSPF